MMSVKSGSVRVCVVCRESKSMRVCEKVCGGRKRKEEERRGEEWRRKRVYEKIHRYKKPSTGPSTTLKFGSFYVLQLFANM